jgi:hypothetical protein
VAEIHHSFRADPFDIDNALNPVNLGNFRSEFPSLQPEAVMKRIKKFAAINIIVALLGTGIPVLAAQNGYGDRGRAQHESADHRDSRDNQNRNVRNDNRGDQDRDRGYVDNRGYGYGYAYAPAPVYVQPAPVYVDRSHDGRTAAIIGGSAAAGALIGAAAGHGQGAVIGAVVGGIAGAAASEAANHHDRY